MAEDAYRYRFDEGVELHKAESTLLLSTLAVEGLYGEARVRMDAAYRVDRTIRAIIVDASTSVGQAVNCVFTALLLRGFGRESFHVRRVKAHPLRRCREAKG